MISRLALAIKFRSGYLGFCIRGVNVFLKNLSFLSLHFTTWSSVLPRFVELGFYPFTAWALSFFERARFIFCSTKAIFTQSRKAAADLNLRRDAKIGQVGIMKVEIRITLWYLCKSVAICGEIMMVWSSSLLEISNGEKEKIQRILTDPVGVKYW